jgi:hypothetical protein
VRANSTKVPDTFAKDADALIGERVMGGTLTIRGVSLGGRLT